MFQNLQINILQQENFSEMQQKKIFVCKFLFQDVVFDVKRFKTAQLQTMICTFLILPRK